MKSVGDNPTRLEVFIWIAATMLITEVLMLVA
jgi:hypothetical protein